MDWEALPAAFRSSFEKAAGPCILGNDGLAEQMLARIEAGEDPEVVMAEADALGIAKAPLSDSRLPRASNSRGR